MDPTCRIEVYQPTFGSHYSGIGGSKDMARSKQTARRSGASEKRKAGEQPAADKKKQKTQKAAAAATGNSSSGDAKSAATATLRELLGGMELDAFFTQHFEKKPLHVRSNGKHKVRYRCNDCGDACNQEVR